MPLLRRKPDTDASESAAETTDHKGIGGLQTSFSRLVATGGIIGIVVAGASVLLAAVVWSSRSL